MLTAFHTFGCTQNNYETQKLRDLLLDCGHVAIEEGEPELIVINSCAVTASAEKGADEMAGRMRKKYPEAIIALVGCYGEVLLRGGQTFKHEDIVLGNNKFQLIDALEKHLAAPDTKRSPTTTRSLATTCPPAATHPPATTDPPAATLSSSATCVPAASQSTAALSKSAPSKPYANTAQAFLHIQNGCDSACSFCIVPGLRGKSMSAPPGRIMDDLKRLLSQGYKEVMIAGINIGLYKSGVYRLIDILSEINAIDSLEGIRLCSLEPMSLDAGFVRGLPGITKLRPHFHISLQSGCDKILALMKRNYTFKQYYSLITAIRGAIREAVGATAAISTDVIVGFPGEGAGEFIESCENIAKCQFSDIHIFKYSPRAGTIAAGMPNHVSAHQKSARANVLEGIKMQACYDFNNRFIGSTERVTIQKRRPGVPAEGVTGHNIKIAVSGHIPTDAGYVDAIVTGLGKSHGSLIGKSII